MFKVRAPKLKELGVEEGDPREQKSVSDEGTGKKTEGSREAEHVLGLIRYHLGDRFPEIWSLEEYPLLDLSP